MHRTEINESNYVDLFELSSFSSAYQANENKALYLKAFLNQAQSTINDEFIAGGSVVQAVQKRAWLIDQLLTYLWNEFGFEQAKDIALVAVGGYGRGELHPHSDIDLLVLFKNDKHTHHIEAVEEFLRLLWDIGIDLGHSVRTLAQCIEEARKDVTIATNLIESRIISGPKKLFTQLQNKTQWDATWTSKEFFKAKRQEQNLRHEKHNYTEYNLEPDLKNAPGGLRDIQSIGWVAKRHFDTSSIQQLIEQGFLSPFEFNALEAGQNFLWELRYHLHILSGRGENKLLFDYQCTIAEKMGLSDCDNSLAVEQLMKRYYRTALALSELNDVLLQHFNEIILEDDLEVEITPINERFQLRNGYMEAVDEAIFRTHPPALLEVFTLMAHIPDLKGVRASTIRQIRDNRHLITEEFRNTPENCQQFMALLKSPYRLFSHLRQMKRYGILGRYIPAFGAVIGQMQYDLFHIYTVDAHTLLAIKNMRRFRYDEEKKRFPIVYYIVKQLPHIEILYLAGLFHDIAKGRGGDHSELGQIDAVEFAQLHDISSKNTRLLAWLVENHLIMSVTAQKKDLSDPDIIHRFAEKVGDETHLDYLYALTVADICATNPSLWTGWKATLLRQLYTETKRALRRGLSTPVDKKERLSETRTEALIRIGHQGVEVAESKIQVLWDDLGEDYFLRESATDIAWHTPAIVNHPHPDQPLVLIRETTDRKFEGGTQIFVYTEDKTHLFAATVAVLTQLGLTIEDARIITSNSNFSLDTYIVLEEDGTPIGDNPGRITAIKQSLTTAIQDTSSYPEIINRRIPRQLKHFDIRTQVSLRDSARHPYSILELSTLDRPGLLAQISAIFVRFQVQLRNARIATLGERAEDVFFLTDQNDQPFCDTPLAKQLEQAFCDQFDTLEQ
ncbi:MAG: [protein-PII] uridylyltransferase [Gammaproteobacteria bacterium]|nr:MAG: [protein-PII] uridylyltransferase [Gammaproteobacteria bacterium]